MDFPDPEPPTRAYFFPASRRMDRSRSTGSPGSYPKVTFSRVMASFSTGGTGSPARPAFSSVTSASFSTNPAAALRLARPLGRILIAFST